MNNKNQNDGENDSEDEIYLPSEDIFSEISKVLEKNGIEETPIEAVFKDGPSFIGIVFVLVKNFAKGNMSEKDFINFLQKQLNVSLKTAESLAKDIKEKILPMAEKIVFEPRAQEEKPTVTTPSKPIINESLNIANRPTIEKQTMMEKEKSAERKRRAINPPEIIKRETLSISKKPDNYREPIE